MGYADYEYYMNGYLLGKSPAVPEAVFLYWEKQAERELDRYTFQRLVSHPERQTDAVKDCVCELAEFLYQADSVSQQALEQGAAGPLASYSNDGESATFDLSRSEWTAAGKTAKIYETVTRYLSGSSLLYQGV